MPAISKKSWLGAAREATPGTAIATPTLYVPTKSIFKNARKKVYLNEERGSRDENYGVVDTIRMASGSAKGPWYNDSSVYFLMGFMGAPVTTQPNAGSAPNVYLHTFNLADVPPAMTYIKSYDAAFYSFPYGATEKLSFNFAGDDKLLEYDASFQALYGTKVTGPFTTAFSTVLPFAGSLATVSFGGGATSLEVEDMKIDLVQKLRLWNGADGSADFTTIYYGGRSVKLDLTLRFDADTFYNKFFATTPTQESIAVTFQGPIIQSTYKQQLVLNFPIVNYDEMEHSLDKENVTLKVKATAMPGVTANSLFNATVQNSIIAYTS